MNRNTNTSNERESESLEDMLNGISRYYDLDITQITGAILVFNGTEYFIIKLKGSKVRKLLHQNHGKTGKPVNLICELTEIDNKIIQKHFHKQILKSTDPSDLKRNLIYIYNHGRKREILDQKRREILAFA
jgi:hypothetical protein